MNEMNRYEVMDGFYGEVIDRCQKGAFIRLDNGEEAFAYKFAGLRTGTKVLCTVLKQARGTLRTLVDVESVISNMGYAA